MTNVTAHSNAGLSGCSNMKLRRLTRLISRHYDAHMAECGLKTTQYSGRDARSRQVSATAAGLDLRAQARQCWKRAQLAFNATLGIERVATLHQLVDDCYRTLAATEDASRQQLSKGNRE